jgi:NADPH-dependent glutamate synthase beta subunit-like oxidoreductase
VSLQGRKPLKINNIGKNKNFNLLWNESYFVKGCLMSDKVLGSVMVVGGGIAGMQASLDLANAGYFVHLVEKSPAIGGTMAQIDKTFPTNDCAM